VRVDDSQAESEKFVAKVNVNVRAIVAGMVHDVVGCAAVSAGNFHCLSLSGCAVALATDDEYRASCPMLQQEC